MKILHISTLERSGGAARVALRLCLAQRETGHDAQMLVGHKESDAPYSHELSYRIDVSLSESCCHRGLLYYELQGSHFLAVHQLVQDADVLHLHNLHGGYFNPFSLLLLGRLKPVVWTLHDMQALTGHCAHSFACERWKTGCAECANLEIYPQLEVDSARRLWDDKKIIYDHVPFHIISPSVWLGNKVKESILGSHSLEIIHNGVDTSVFKPYDKIESRRRLGLPVDAFIVGGVAHGGALKNSWKGGAYTLEALKVLFDEVEDSVYVGVGSPVSETDWNGRLINLAVVDNEEEMAWVYSALDLYLMTSVAENFPLVLLEALACGLPVLSFATGGIPEIISNGVNGLIVEQRDLVEFCRGLLALSLNRQLLKLFALNARDTAITLFDHDKIAAKYEQSYCDYMSVWKTDRLRFSKIDQSMVPLEVSSEVFLKCLSMVNLS